MPNSRWYNIEKPRKLVIRIMRTAHDNSKNFNILQRWYIANRFYGLNTFSINIRQNFHYKKKRHNNLRNKIPHSWSYKRGKLLRENREEKKYWAARFTSHTSVNRMQRRSHIDANQMVQPQNKKKKQSMETRATDSNAITTPHTNSSTTLRVISSDVHRITDDRAENFTITHRNIDAIATHPLFQIKAPFSFSLL